MYGVLWHGIWEKLRYACLVDIVVSDVAANRDSFGLDILD